MNTNLPQSPNDQRPKISRAMMLRLLNTALQVRSLRFARQAALSWLAAFPGDLQIGLRLGQALLAEGKRDQAVTLLEKLVSLDPEFLEAQQMLAQAALGSNEKLYQVAQGNVFVLGGKTPADFKPSDGIQLLQAVRAAVHAGKLEEAEPLMQKALGLTPYLPLAAVYHLELTRKNQDFMTVYRLAGLYQERWPDCLQFALCKAEARLQTGDETGAVEILHRCVANDAAGQVAEHLWGRNHAYLPLWPERMEAPFDLPVPADVAVPLGGNQLEARIGRLGAELPTEPPAVRPDDTLPVKIDLEEADEAAPVETAPVEAAPVARQMPEFPPRPNYSPSETLRSVEEELDRMAKRLNQPGIGRVDGRFPVYVILSTRGGLRRQYGQEALTGLDKEMHLLADTVARRPGWGSMVFYPDDSACMERLGLQTVEVSDPWKIKLALVDLDQWLARKGEMIGALLIVGGPQVVPFHHLPNPTDDADVDVASDNPYATLDANYFVPEWPVGRFPGEDGADASLLVDQLRRSIRLHTQEQRRLAWWQRMRNLLLGWLHMDGRSPNFGYSAAVWQRSSLAAFRPIGEARLMRMSPPEASGSFESAPLLRAPLGYYNLHGMEDAAEWFGQRDQLDPTPGPDYPVALSPADLQKNGHSPLVVFSEACHGGNIARKKASTAIALRFLALGTRAVVASTRVSYGSISTPLIGADLLGQIFWRHLNAGFPVGAALMQAKIDLAREMNRRQGYLDGEDQKTLISFVLYGDPLVSAAEQARQAKSLPRLREHPAVKTISDAQGETPPDAQRVSAAVLKQVQQLVEEYLPGMDGAQVRVNPQEMSWDGAGARGGAKARPEMDHVVVTVRKQVAAASRVHQHYARVTVDKSGKMVKVVLSR